MGRKLSLDEVVKGFREVHGNDYDYSLITKENYVDTHHNVQIKCNTCGLVFPQTPHAHKIGQGCPACGYRKVGLIKKGKPNMRSRSLVFGVGVFDEDICSRENGGTLHVYRMWFDMLRRCYDEKYKNTKCTYIDCCVCEEWKRFSVFHKWFDKHKEEYKEGYQLDKDILVKGNKVYSPETCCFVPAFINALILNGGAKRNTKNGDTPIGVTYYCKRYYARMSKYGEVVKIGSFDNEKDAFNAYKQAREEYIKEVANEYYTKGLITKRVYDALYKWTVEITD